MKLKPPTVYDDKTDTELVEWCYVVDWMFDKLKLPADLKSDLWRYRRRYRRRNGEFWVWDEFSKKPVNRDLMYNEDFEKWESGLKELPQEDGNYDSLVRIERALCETMKLEAWIVYPCNPSSMPQRTTRMLEQLYPFDEAWDQLTESHMDHGWPVLEYANYPRPEQPRYTLKDGSVVEINGDRGCSLWLPWEGFKAILENFDQINTDRKNTGPKVFA